MWDIGATVLVAATLVPAAPAQPPLPDLRDLPGQACTLPVSGSLTGCPDQEPRPFLSCVLPVDLPGTLVVPDACPRRDPAPEGRVVPVLPVSP